MVDAGGVTDAVELLPPLGDHVKEPAPLFTVVVSAAAVPAHTVVEFEETIALGNNDTEYVRKVLQLVYDVNSQV